MARLLGHIPVNAQTTRMDSSPDQKRFSKPDVRVLGCNQLCEGQRRETTTSTRQHRHRVADELATTRVRHEVLQVGWAGPAFSLGS
jgi:hypothetical protein